MHFISENNEYYFSSDIPEGSWLVGDKVNPKCDLLRAFRISGFHVQTDIPKEYKSFLHLRPEGSKEQIMWQYIMPKNKWKNWLFGIIEEINNNIEKVNFKYYENIFLKCNEVLSGFSKIKIDEEKWKGYLLKEKNPSIVMQLRSFRPDINGYSKKIKYDQEHTVSGRLQINEKYPQLLTIRKDLRDVITSRYENGSILMVDCVSIEPRIALHIAGKKIPDDIYVDLSTNVFNNKITRDIAKIFVLSAMYGAGAEAVSQQSGFDEDDCRLYYVPKVKEYFSIPKIAKELYEECCKSEGKIKNLFGRILTIEDRSSYKLYSNKVQSSAVDICLLIFNNMMNNLIGTKTKSLGVIHDCLLLDIDNSEEELVRQKINDSLYLKEINDFVPVGIKKL